MYHTDHCSAYKAVTTELLIMYTYQLKKIEHVF